MNMEIRESLKNDKILTNKYRINENNNMFNDFKINKVYKYSQSLLIKAIKYGMIINIIYEGEKDDKQGGRERTISPLVLGINKNTKNTLVRGWHLEGYSVGKQSNAQKVWRLFNVDNIKSMTFTGNYLQLAPKGYRLNDRIMTERTIQKADFNEIRRNQNNLVQKGFVELEEESNINSKNTIEKIKVKKTDAHIDLVNPWNNDILKGKQNDASQIKLTVLKSNFGNNWMCIVGAIGTINRSVVLYEQVEFLKIFKKWKETKLGTYKVMDSFRADELKSHRHIRGISQMPIYLYKGKK
jgi:hypothetical protein